MHLYHSLVGGNVGWWSSEAWPPQPWEVSTALTPSPYSWMNGWSQFYSQFAPSFGPSSESIAIALHHNQNAWRSCIDRGIVALSHTQSSVVLIGLLRTHKPQVGIKLLAGAFPKREYQNCLSYIGQGFHKSLINLDKRWRGIIYKLLFLLMFCRLAKARVISCWIVGGVRRNWTNAHLNRIVVQKNLRWGGRAVVSDLMYYETCHLYSNWFERSAEDIFPTNFFKRAETAWKGYHQVWVRMRQRFRLELASRRQKKRKDLTFRGVGEREAGVSKESPAIILKNHLPI